MKLIVLLLAFLTGLGVWETWRHGRHRRRIPVRIHVNGTRGKSSVARLIGAGLRGGGLRVVAKTTGSAAALVHVDGTETRIRRRGGPNIREQLAVVRAAVAERCDALVIECMAVRPDLQRTCEQSIVQATHGVITNVRPDHLEVMGPSLDDVAASLAGTVPQGTKLFTAEAAYAGHLESVARQRGSSFRLCGPATSRRTRWPASPTRSSPTTWRWPWRYAWMSASNVARPWPRCTRSRRMSAR
ncbi:MAG: poly-gamma-glutamate synthase PgsB [bacterium]|nr:poly-gamma-glutamate synthase PgsB [bacterium]